MTERSWRSSLGLPFFSREVTALPQMPPPLLHGASDAEFVAWARQRRKMVVLCSGDEGLRQQVLETTQVRKGAKAMPSMPV